MPNSMGSSDQAGRYSQCLVTGSNISITIKVKEAAFTHTGTTAADAVYNSTVSNLIYFCLVPFNSTFFNALGGVDQLQLMPWAQAIRQPGARRMALSGIDGKSRGTLRAYCSVGAIEGVPSWESDPNYRSTSAVGGIWGHPTAQPFGC